MTTSGRNNLRVLDLSMGWAGPLAGQMLAEMGFEVIKIEDTRHFDWWRGALGMGPAEMRPIERSHVFNSVNRGKLDLTLDLGDPRGVAIVKRLVEISDLFIENFSPGVVERLGLGYRELKRLNQRLIMVSMPSFGSNGPESGSRGYGNTVEAMAGITGLCRYHDSDRPYMLSNALGDPIGALHGVLGLLAALHERERTGSGQWVEVAQVEAAIPMLAEKLIACELSGELPRPRGNRHPRYAPHGIYPCAGEDEWLALACESEDQWRALTRALGIERVASDPRFKDAEARKRNEDALDAEVGMALSRLETEAAARLLNDAQVYAAPVSNAAQVLADPQLQTRGFFVPIERAVVGTHLYPGAVARLEETPLCVDKPSPLLGEHNERVLGGILGMNADEISDLESAGVIGSSPRE